MSSITICQAVVELKVGHMRIIIITAEYRAIVVLCSVLYVIEH